MLIIHTPRFIVVKTPPGSKKTRLLSHLNSAHTGRALQHAHSAGKQLFLFPGEIPDTDLAFSLPQPLGARGKSPEGMPLKATTKGHFARGNVAAYRANVRGSLGHKDMGSAQSHSLWCVSEAVSLPDTNTNSGSVPFYIHTLYPYF